MIDVLTGGTSCQCTIVAQLLLVQTRKMEFPM